MDYIYDLVGKIQQVNDPSGTYTFAYDNMGRLLGTSTQYSFLPGNTYANIYTYDKASNRTSFSDPQGQTTNYVYDNLNRLQTLQSPQGSFGFSYDALSRRTQMTRPNSVNTNYTYDSLSRLLSVLHQNGSTTIDGATYTYDNAGNRLTKLNHLNAVTETYGYDNIYQLLSVLQGSTTTESYTYDKGGNRLSSLGGITYTVNNSNQLTSKTSVTYTYDNNGNTATKVDGTGTTTYSWNSENQLTQVSLPGGTAVTFKYDQFGRRAQKVSASGTVNYLYDGPNVAEELDSTGVVVAKYSQGSGVDHPLAMSRGTTNYYLEDGLGSITSLTDNSGAQAATYAYDSFGKLTASSGALMNPSRYTAREFETETGLYYYRARYYDSTIGRFVNEDPLGYMGGPNVYSYVSNNPLNLTDATGLKGKKPKAPEVSPNAIFFICCKKGQLALCEYNLGQNVRGNGPDVQCQYAHENQHLADFKRDCPPGTKDFCIGKPNNAPVIVGTDEKRPVECRGYCAELKCLEGKGPHPEVLRRKPFVERAIRENCGAAGCPR